MSALTHAGVSRLLDIVASLDTRYTAHIATAELNRALAALAGERPLPQKRGRRLKMYYIAQFGTAPPRFAVDVNDRSLMTRDYGYFVLGEETIHSRESHEHLSGIRAGPVPARA